MKKTGWILLIVLVVAICGGVLLFNGYHPAQSPSVSSGAGSASAPSSSVSSKAPSSASGPESVSSLTDDKITEKIKSEIPLDWKKYTLKEQTDNPVSAGGVTYRTYAAWDEDYTEGPLILYSPKDGKLYTYTYKDTAPVLAAEDPAFDKTEHTVTGVVKDGAMMSVQIHTTDGSDLTIRRLGVDLVNLDDGFKVGQNVKVTYTGVYKGNDSQRMFVKKIEGIQ
ncbi:hypothetical protein CAFE_04550 [Caprobacter fermentans]|uniref:Uncharacterized protein n=1 Tax=Caproicibacter fermentans TaxID=2576756 RepID=A0A6N8HW61_9FIRM|nr:hypothetical protein [Caproicibacter fermentans]MVB09790.1 hypothetical protein [Caproicibacter fermentans]OCN03191.1 hypothetical protein A7X67_13780 [Clostridium sp. W14A]QNK42329.1 hypothetical protein HCR03_09040 [Caproicibacter fermentans]